MGGLDIGCRPFGVVVFLSGLGIDDQIMETNSLESEKAHWEQ